MVSEVPSVEDESPWSETFSRRLLRSARLQGAWDPQSLDLSKDQHQWELLTTEDRAPFLQLCTLFLGGEEAVVRDLSRLSS